jgi:hypothetical protein
MHVAAGLVPATPIVEALEQDNPMAWEKPHER